MTAAAAAFRAWCLGLSGCDGGDIGDPQHPSVWVCGIEPGGPGAVDARRLQAAVAAERVVRHAPGYRDWQTILAHSFTRRIAKLLVAMHGGAVADYRAFAAARRPFALASRGFFKLNLYPVGFADTDPKRWNDDFARVTGFAGKPAYLSWCDGHRLPALRERAERSRPSVILCIGKGWHRQFRIAFLEENAALAGEMIEGRQLLWGINREGSIVAVVPFLTSAGGLQSDAAIGAFGARLRDIAAGRGVVFRDRGGRAIRHPCEGRR